MLVELEAVAILFWNADLSLLSLNAGHFVMGNWIYTKMVEEECREIRNTIDVSCSS